MSLFTNENVHLESLRKKAFNFRWATVAKDVIPLTAADPDFPVAKEIIYGIQEYCKDGYFSYCPAEGLPMFKQAISNWYNRRFQVEASPQSILPVNSAAFGLFTVAKLILGQGYNAIIPNPVDFLFRKSIENAGAEVRTCDIDQNANFNLENLVSKIDAKTKAIFICNPNNPIGKTISKQHLNEIIGIAQKYNLWIVSDEIWADIVYDDSFVSIRNKAIAPYDKKIIVSGLSKNFGLAGLRIGYIICASDENCKEMLAASGHESTAMGLSGLSQAAGTAALNDCQYWLDDFLAHLQEMRKKSLNFIRQASFLEEVNPNATYLIFPKLKNIKNPSTQFVESIQEHCKVALVPGGEQWFEAASENHIRICYSTSAAILDEAFHRILQNTPKLL